MKCLLASLFVCASAATAVPAQAAGLSRPELLALVRQCAPQVAPSTMVAILEHESGGDPLAIGVNGNNPQALHPANAEQAAATVEKLLAAGRSVDVGLGQINNANFDWLGLDAQSAFDPCRNIAAAAEVLTKAYVRLRTQAPSNQAALDAALSTYNTGSPVAGVSNGYVGAVRGGYTVPALKPTQAKQAPVQVHATRRPAPAWDVYGTARRPSASKPAAPAPVMVFQGEAAQ